MERRGREALADHLLSEIMSGRLPAGDKLPPERHLAQTFGVSRPIVREVLRGLQERGLVQIAAGQGSFVRKPRTVDGARSLESYYRRRNATARDVMDARLVLETGAARLAATNADPGEIAALRHALEACEAADNVVDAARFDLAFHGLLARASRNPVVEMMFASIAQFTFELMLRSHTDTEVVRQGLPQHRLIAEAVERRAPDEAERAMREHLTLASALYGEDYDRSVENLAGPGLRSVSGLSLEDLLDQVTRRAAGA